MPIHQYQRGDWIGGEYSVLQVFGGEKQSGMGVVYLVQGRELPKPIVLKTYQGPDSETARQQFVKEGQAWVRAGVHPNIVQAHWVRELDGRLFVAAEYVMPDSEGRNCLSQYIRSVPIPLEVILPWASHFCRGMEYAQSKGVLIHRDIKPANLMITPDGQLKITDFGLAKSALDDSRRQNIHVDHSDAGTATAKPLPTFTATGMGTLPYMAPEQLVSTMSVDHRADLYSFGIVLYQLVTGGKYPYGSPSDPPDSEQAFAIAHLKSPVRTVPSRLMPIIDRCLLKSPASRYQSYDELHADLLQLAKALSIRIAPVTQHSPDAEELYAKAQSFVALGESDDALFAIDEYVERFPDNECGWTEKGRLHLERAEYAAARQATLESIRRNPNNAHPWNNLGIILGRLGAPAAEARQALTTAIRLDPSNTSAMLNLVRPLVQSKSYQEAVETVSRALRLRPEKQAIRHNAEGLLQELLTDQQYEHATKLLVNWTKECPGDPTAWHNRGILALHGEIFDLAIECFSKVHSLDPDDNFSLIQLAKLFFREKRARDCLACCDLLLGKGVEQLLAITLKARVLNVVAGYSEALTLLKPYIENNPDNDALLVVRAEMHAYHGKTSAAGTDLLRAKHIVERGNGKERAENLALIDAKLRDLGVRSG